MQRVNIIGAGKVGRTFLALIGRRGGALAGDVLSGGADSARAAVAAAGAGRAVAHMSEMAAADLWLLTVPDDRITTVAAKLAQGAPPAVAVHCSGFLSSEVLAPLRAKGWAVASCHPVRSFADPGGAARDFDGTPCGIEGDPAAVSAIGALATALGGAPFAVDTGKKALYHAAAVFANNFAVVLQGIAMDAWAAAGVAPEVARRLDAALLAGTARNVSELGPRDALTGPAARGDTAVLNAQHDAVAAWHPDAAEIYGRMTALAQRLKNTGTTLPGP